MSKADSGIVDKAAAGKYLLNLRNDPRFFVTELWKDRRLDKVAPLSDIELDMIVFGLSGPVRRGILGARGTGKTTSVTCPLIAWRAFRAFYRFATHGELCPDRKFIIISKAAAEARKTISLVREWIDHVWFLRHLAPSEDQYDRSDFFDFGPAIRGSSKQPSVTAYGNVGQLEGNRGHTVIPDDFETKANTGTQEAREELMRIAAEFDNVAFPDAPGAEDKPIDKPEVCTIGTYKHEDSSYKRLARLKMPDGRLIYTFRTYPLASPARSDKFLNLAPAIVEGLNSGRLKYTENGNYHLNPLFPKRFDSDDIGRKMSHGRHEFAMEHMLKSDLDDALKYPLRLSDLIIHDVARDTAPVTITWGRADHNGENAGKGVTRAIPMLGQTGDSLHPAIALDKEHAPYVATKAFVDPAGVGKDKTGLAVASLLNGSYWVKHCKGHKGGVSVPALAALATLIRHHGAREVFVETNIDVFDTFTPLLEVELAKLRLAPGVDPLFPHGWTCSVDRVHNTGMKEERICDVLEPVVGSHRLIMDPAILMPDPAEEEHESVQYQWTRIQRVRKCLKEDGALDALASCIARFQASTGGVRTDPAKQRGDKIIQNLKKTIRRLNPSAHPAPRLFKHT